MIMPRRSGLFAALAVLAAMPAAACSFIERGIVAAVMWLVAPLRGPAAPRFSFETGSDVTAGEPLDAGLQHSLRHEAGFHRIGAPRHC